MRGVKLNLFVFVLGIVFLMGIVSAANTVTLYDPAQDASISGSSYMLNASVDTNTFNMSIVEFFYEYNSINTTIGIYDNDTELSFNETWDTTALQDINNIKVWANISNSTDSNITMDSSTGVDIDNGNPTATLSSNHIHDGYRAAIGDSIQLAIDADTTIGIDNCTYYFVNVRTKAIDNKTYVSATSDACSNSYTISDLGGLSEGETYTVYVEATDNNVDKTNSTGRTLKILADGQIIKTTIGGEEGEGLTFRERFSNFFSNIGDGFKEFIQKIKNIFRRGA